MKRIFGFSTIQLVLIVSGIIIACVMFNNKLREPFEYCKNNHCAPNYSEWFRLYGRMDASGNLLPLGQPNSSAVDLGLIIGLSVGGVLFLLFPPA